MSWSFDSSHSEVSFSVRHMMIAKVRGSFPTWSGTVEADDAGKLTALTVDIDTASVNTREAQRDAHLASADFFNSAAFPKMTFVSTRIAPAQDGEFDITGKLTIKDVTREVVLRATFNGTGKDPWGNTRRGYGAKTRVNRTEFGLTWNAALELGGVLVGEDVDIELDVQIVQKA